MAAGVGFYLVCTALIGWIPAMFLNADRVRHDNERSSALQIAPTLRPGTGAICRDGRHSYSVGWGTCSWHGGVRMWASDLRRMARSKPWIEGKRVLLVSIATAWLIGGIAFIRLLLRSATHDPRSDPP